MLPLPAGCVKAEKGLGVCPEQLSASKKKSSHRDLDALLAVLQSKAQHWPLPTLHQGLGRVRRCLLVRTGLSVFQKHCGGRGPALVPAEMTHLLLHLRSTRTVVCLSSLGVVAQYQRWKHLESE